MYIRVPFWLFLILARYRAYCAIKKKITLRWYNISRKLLSTVTWRQANINYRRTYIYLYYSHFPNVRHWEPTEHWPILQNENCLGHLEDRIVFLADSPKSVIIALDELFLMTIVAAQFWLLRLYPSDSGLVEVLSLVFFLFPPSERFSEGASQD